MKKTLCILTLAAITVGTGAANAQSRRGDATRGGQCMVQIKRLRSELISAQNQLTTCQSNAGASRRLREELRMCRDAESLLNSDLNQCQNDLEQARRTRPGNGNGDRLREENQRLVEDNNRLNTKIERQRDRIQKLRFKIQDLEDQLNGGGLPPEGLTYSAECQVDDDPGFDFGQFSMGRLTGTLAQIQADCKSISRSTYGSNSSQGLAQIKFQGDTEGLTSAICEIDDDPTFDYGQFSQSSTRIYGYNINEIILECKELAKFTFGGNGSSGIKEVRNN